MAPTAHACVHAARVHTLGVHCVRTARALPLRAHCTCTHCVRTAHAHTACALHVHTPAVLSVRTPKKRSSDPKMARCSMMGCALLPSGAVYSRPKRSGRLKSA